MYQLEDLEGLEGPKGKALLQAGAQAGASKAAEMVASALLPGGPITGFVAGKLIGATIGKAFGKKAKTKYRREKKKLTRMAGKDGGDEDCISGQHKAGGTRGWPAKPHKEYVAAYNLAYNRCVAAIRDCRDGQYGKRLPAKFPGQRSKDYPRLFKKGYDEWFQKCPPEAKVTPDEQSCAFSSINLSGSMTPLLVAGALGAVILFSARK